MNKILFYPHQFVGVTDMVAIQTQIEEYALKHNMEVVSIDGFVYEGFEVKALATPGMGFFIEQGSAWLNYRNTCNYADFNGVVPAAHSTLPRIDLVAIKHSTQETDEVTVAFRDPVTKLPYTELKNVKVKNYFELIYVTGTPSEAPELPAVPEGALEMASIDVNAGASSILQPDITDLRPMKPDYLVSNHRTMIPIDHPPESIGNLHIAGNADISLAKISGFSFPSLLELIRMTTFIPLPGTTAYSYNLDGRLTSAYFAQIGVLETYEYTVGGRIEKTITETANWKMTESYEFANNRISGESRVLEAKL